MSRLATLLSALYLICIAIVNAYEIPEVFVEALKSSGLRVSIPDEVGIKLFAFHGNINKEIKKMEEGSLSKDVTEAVNGYWTFVDNTVLLDYGDKIHFWIKVEHFDGELRRSHYKRNLTFIVDELISEENLFGPPHKTSTTVLATRTFPIIDEDSSQKNRTTWKPYTTTQSTSSSSSTRPTTSSSTWTPFTTRTTTPATTAHLVTYRTTTKRSTTTTYTTPTTTTTTKTPECKYTPTLINGKRSCQGKLIFDETFGELSDKRWQTEVKFAGDPDYEFVIYQDDKENLYVENDMLHIKPTLVEERYGPGFVVQPDGLDLGDNCTGLTESFDCVQKPKAWLTLPPVLSAQITTKDRFCFVYGVIEIRAKLPKGDWIYPELLLLSRNEDYGLGYNSGTLKIAYTPGNEDLSKILHGGCILGASVVARNYGLKTIRSDVRWTDDFHVFRMEWKTDSITLIVDDQVFGNIYPPDGGFAQDEIELELDNATAQRWKKGGVLAPFDKEMYLTMGVGVGGHCFANKKEGAKQPWVNDDPKAQLNFYRAQDVWHKTWNENSNLLIDYVKVWAL